MRDLTVEDEDNRGFEFLAVGKTKNLKKLKKGKPHRREVEVFVKDLTIEGKDKT